MNLNARRRLQVIAAIAVVLTSFLSGLASGRSHVFSQLAVLLNNLQAVHKGLERWSSTNPLSLLMLWTAVLALLAPLRRPVSRFFEPATMLDIIFDQQAEIQTILPQILGATFLSQVSRTQIVMPSNTPLLPFEDALAIELIAETIEKRYRGRKRLVFDSQGGRTSRGKRFISVGGPSVNVAAYALWKSIPWFTHRFEDEVFGWKEKEFRIKRGEESGSTSPPVETDYGFIIIAANPYTKVRSVYLWGGWAPGTYGAAKVFLEVDNTRVHRKIFVRVRSMFGMRYQGLMDKLRDHVTRGESVIAVVEVTEIDMVYSNTELVMVDAFQMVKPSPPQASPIGSSAP